MVSAHSDSLSSSAQHTPRVPSVPYIKLVLEDHRHRRSAACPTEISVVLFRDVYHLRVEVSLDVSQFLHGSWSLHAAVQSEKGFLQSFLDFFFLKIGSLGEVFNKIFGHVDRNFFSPVAVEHSEHAKLAVNLRSEVRVLHACPPALH